MAYSVPATHTLSEPIFQALDAVSTTQLEALGKTVYSSSGRKFTYCEVADDGVVTTVAGWPASLLCGSQATVTSYSADAATTQGGLGFAFHGVFCTTIAATTEQYCWVERPNGAVTPDVSVSTNVAASSALSLIGTADAYLDTFAGGVSTKIIAIACEAATSNMADIMMLAE